MLKSIKTSVVALIFVSTAIIAHAQKKMSEGTIVYGIKYKIEAPGAPEEQKVKFNGDISKLEMEFGPAAIGVLMDSKSQTGMVLVDIPVAQKQYAAKMTKADMEESNAAKPKYSDFKATGEKKTVSGYNAEKYTFKDDKGGTGELWATLDVEVPANIATADFKDVKGTIVLVDTPQATITLKSLTEGKVGELSVTKAPAGYDEITYAELKAMQQQGGGE
ncbi:DUF4412 domain-containing protein [Pedobacter jejuensis]|uniref:DUF4412 domain-containing protein n=1 Tax=Pedobacter jejuensis TaxID=1268550 RepID=A0A3N0BUA9_9SPHI|nr:DUF4412 domain-containing protein [Pedobacter jejuensis]RNL52292.1 DUF4412 domain-containing protein [Pedobacter jejuensis]